MESMNWAAGMAGLAFLMAGACASIEPEPCTADWVEWKKDRVLTSFAREHRSTIKLLRGLENDLENPNAFTALKIASATDDIGDMADSFSRRVVPEIQASIRQCSADPVRATQLMAELLEDQGVDDDVVAWVWTLGAIGVLQEG